MASPSCEFQSLGEALTYPVQAWGFFSPWKIVSRSDIDVMGTPELIGTTISDSTFTRHGKFRSAQMVRDCSRYGSEVTRKMETKRETSVT